MITARDAALKPQPTHRRQSSASRARLRRGMPRAILEGAEGSRRLRFTARCVGEGGLINAVFKALSDPTRREVLRLLSRGERSAGELAEPFDMTKPSMSHHFAVLKEADLVRTRRDGQTIYYSLNTTVMEDVLTRIWDLFTPGRARGDGPPGAKDDRP